MKLGSLVVYLYPICKNCLTFILF